MPDTQMKLEGVDELRRAMRNMPTRVSNKHIRRATNQGAAIFRNDIRRRAPVRTGRLRKNIKSRARRGGRSYKKAQVYVQVGERTQRRATATGEFLSGRRDFRLDPRDAFYWRFVERGTKHVAARPFIRPAVDAKFGEVVNHVVREADSGIRAELTASKVK